MYNYQFNTELYRKYVFVGENLPILYLFPCVEVSLRILCIKLDRKKKKKNKYIYNTCLQSFF